MGGNTPCPLPPPSKGVVRRANALYGLLVLIVHCFGSILGRSQVKCYSKKLIHGLMCVLLDTHFTMDLASPE